MFYIDPLYIVMILPALLLGIYAQIRVKRAVGRYSRVGTMSGMTGAHAARRILDAAGLSAVTIEETQGWLSDHYDPRSKTLRLSPGIHSTPSVAAVGIAAHEAGHALQHAQGYALLRFRNAVVPTAQFGSWLAFPLIILGVLIAWRGLALLGLLLFGAIALFQVITLPVELNASSRARKLVFDMGIVQSQEEAEGVSSVLSAAALTYVAATVSALVTVLYWALRLGVIGGRDD